MDPRYPTTTLCNLFLDEMEKFGEDWENADGCSIGEEMFLPIPCDSCGGITSLNSPIDSTGITLFELYVGGVHLWTTDSVYTLVCEDYPYYSVTRVPRNP